MDVLLISNLEAISKSPSYTNVHVVVKRCQG